MVQAVGRTGVCWDNSVAESLWSSLKREVVHRYRFPDRATARRAIFAWINTYNHRRLHSSWVTSRPSSGRTTTVNPGPTRPRNPRDRSAGGASVGAFPAAGASCQFADNRALRS
jgi:transposase InsO family protein